MPVAAFPLDNSLYFLAGNELDFFKAQTGLHDESELKHHILTVQEKAYTNFTVIHASGGSAFFSMHPVDSSGDCLPTRQRLSISHLPAYQQAPQLLREHPDAVFLDIGCCFGYDLRKLVADGWPVEHTVASDFKPEFWELGHELFRSTPESFPACFIPGNAFDPKLIEPREPFYDELQSPPPSLNGLTSLTPLQGRLSVIHASLFFHLFDQQGQLELARLLATLLSPAAGSMMFGMHVGWTEKKLRSDVFTAAGNYMFCHSPESWDELWNEVFLRGSVRIQCRLQNIEAPDLLMLQWSVTRL